MAIEYKTWQIGDVKVTRVLEQEAPLPPEALIGNIDPGRLEEHKSWLVPDFMNEQGQIVLSIHALPTRRTGSGRRGAPAARGSRTPGLHC